MPQSLVVASWPGPGTGNDYIERFCESLIVAGIKVISVDHPWQCLTKEIDILHIHWPEQTFWGAGRLLGSIKAVVVVFVLIVLRLRGVKIVWCVHNLKPHDAGLHLLTFWKMYSALVARLVNGFITLSPSTVAIARANFTGLAKKPAIFVWHPAYLLKKDSMLGLEWRKRRGIDTTRKIMAFVGHVRPYKGVEELVAAFRKTSDRSLLLVVTGRIVDPQLRSILESAADQDKRIILEFRLLTDSELLEVTLAADVLVLPFRQIFHSGSIIYGLSCGKIVITPSTPFANDLQKQVGDDWIKTYAPPLLTTTLLRLSEEIAIAQSSKTPNLDFLSIQSSGIKLQAFYNKLKGNIESGLATAE